MTDWREELIEKMARAVLASLPTRREWDDLLKHNRNVYLRQARAALAVAEPVIRERANVALREENARLQDLLDNALGWLDDKEHEKPLLSVDSTRAARAAIREGGKDD